MSETLMKLRPDRDLQCYFQHPSAIAALSGASASGFTLSGTWRQQFDWAVIEWNRDNTFEHPMLRNLPDGDLSGLQLTYQETRQNCIALDSSLYPTIDWPYLRIWAESGSAENVYKVPLRDHAAVVSGNYVPASGTFELDGSQTAGDYVELAWAPEHYTYQLSGLDTLETAAEAITQAINASSPTMAASRTGRQITLTYLGTDPASGLRQSVANSTTGVEGNRLGVYANVSSGGTESWQPSSQYLSGGASPTQWKITLDFSSLRDVNGEIVPTKSVRKLRWTYAADLQAAAYQRGEFQVTVANWAVTGSGLGYQVAGEGSRRIEDDASGLVYAGSWSSSVGNYSGGSIHVCSSPGASVSYTYTDGQDHALLVGTRRAANCGRISITIDSQPVVTVDLLLPEEDVLLRVPLGNLSGGVPHTVTITHAGDTGKSFYFDFLEIALLSIVLPDFRTTAKVTLATDWDTDHSIALPAERTAWLIRKLGFTGRANHYAGALWFYELVREGHSYASGTVQFSGTPVFSALTEVSVGPPGAAATLQHRNLVGDSASSVAKAFELQINNGYTGIWAAANGPGLRIYSRQMGAAGNALTLSASPSDPSGPFSAQVSGPTFSGGADGDWRTDLTATPRVNRAARDWSRSFFAALNSYGIDVAAAFSMEVQHGDPSVSAGIAQRYSDGEAVQLNTPALQTNFSPTSLAFWRDVHLNMASLMAQAGVTPYLQFGEVQWWYFTWDNNGTHPSLPFYDDYTTATFNATYGRPMHVFQNSQESPAQYPQEAAFLSGLIGNFTNAIMAYVRQIYPAARFEVLYPPDVNDSSLNAAINLPVNAWTSASLSCFKTENFTFTGNRNLNQVRDSIAVSAQMGFLADKSSHLVGIGDYTTPWLKEAGMSMGEGLESVVLFALDQFCLIGYPVPLPRSFRRSVFMG